VSKLLNHNSNHTLNAELIKDYLNQLQFTSIWQDLTIGVIVVVFYFTISYSIAKSLQFQNRSKKMYLLGCKGTLATTLT
jgi:hypothetical protein